jgi:hypothetical protein
MISSKLIVLMLAIAALWWLWGRVLRFDVSGEITHVEGTLRAFIQAVKFAVVGTLLVASILVAARAYGEIGTGPEDPPQAGLF